MTELKSLRLPPPLKPGDLLQVFAPSGALREFEALEQGIEIWRSRGYHLEMSENWNLNYGYLAGSDNQRRQALKQAWQNPECKGIICIRGGYGGARLLEDWTWELGENALLKWSIGFSDVTSLLWSLAKTGVSSVHGPVLISMAKEPDWSIQRLFDCVEGRPLAPIQGEGWGRGKAAGLLLPANLTVATHLLHTPLQPCFNGVILALEDVNEAPYRIDRMLTQWRMSGAFKGVRGIALGRFSRCDAPVGIASWSVEEVLRDRLCDLDIPIVSNLPFGHDGANAALLTGQIACLDGDRGILAFPGKEILFS